jgi:excisionase family DNA binding protein
MNDRLYSAEEAAQILGLQVRTVRSYLRDGRLPGVRIGKQYRIARSTLDAFAGSGPVPIASEERAARASPAPTEIQVSSVVQVDRIDARRVDRIARTLMAATLTRPDGAPHLRVEPLYDVERQTLKVILIGSAAETAELIRVVEAAARDNP